ncbi:MAG TPA: hypothetical protein VJS11_13375 [Acidobacteriaceae bacterium]|nr:hypothetical protein [Acidobacteriaceae bacterium]
MHAALATDASVAIKVDDAVGAPEQRPGRTDFNAGSGVAMIASQYSKMAARVGKRALFDVLDPGAKNTDGYFVLFLACDRTRVAADTSVLIDDETKILLSHSGSVPERATAFAALFRTNINSTTRAPQTID